MSRTPATFKQTDVTRAIKAARAGGLKVVRVEISRDGAIVLVDQNDGPKPATDFQEWKAKRDARAAQGR